MKYIIRHIDNNYKLIFIFCKNSNAYIVSN